MGIELLLEWEGRTFPVGLRAELQAAAFGRRPKAAAGGESGTPPESWGLLHWSEKVLLLPLLASSSRVDHFLHGLSKVSHNPTSNTESCYIGGTEELG